MMTRTAVRPYRTTARVVGVVYLAGFVVGIVGIMLIQSVLGAPDHLATVAARSMTLAFAAILWLLAVVGDAAHGVLMFPVLKPHSERIAVGYLAFRILDAVFIAIMVIFVLLQIPLGSAYLSAAAPAAPALQALSTVFVQAQLYAYEIGMITLGISGLMLCSTLYRAQLVPRWLAVWGLAGYAVITIGMVSAILGSGLGDLSSSVGGLWEVFVGVWLIVKGFNTAAVTPEAAHADSDALLNAA
ncbi:MAG: DUF4386 domain-containing protein [Chloroflexi bacterium]|nr:DUF4386 domain-containing protein [Chloroflexota bacterium]